MKQIRTTLGILVFSLLITACEGHKSCEGGAPLSTLVVLNNETKRMSIEAGEIGYNACSINTSGWKPGDWQGPDECFTNNGTTVIAPAGLVFCYEGDGKTLTNQSGKGVLKEGQLPLFYRIDSSPTTSPERR